MSTPEASQAMQEFRDGVTATLRSWSAFRTAVDSGWGGVESQAKAEDLRDNLYRVFDGSSNPPRSMTQEDLEDNLTDYMEDQFSIVLEDNSERQVADTLWRMYDACFKGDNTLAKQMVVVAEKAVAESVGYPVQVQLTEHDDDDDDEMVDESASAQPQPILSAGEYASQSLFGAPQKTKKLVDDGPVRQLGKAGPEPPPPAEMDEEGFASVPSKKGRRKSKPV